MSELVAFLEARLAEDEAAARAATDGGYGWRLTEHPGANEVWADRDASGHDAFMVATTCTTLNPNPAERGYRDAAHIARHDPARVLREVTAKRTILAGLRDAEAVVARIGPDLTAPGDAAEWANYHAWHEAAEAAASVWSDHPDFQEQWRPDASSV